MRQVGRPLVALVALYAGAVTADRFTDAPIAWWAYGLAAAALALTLVTAARRDPPPMPAAAAAAGACYALAAVVAAGPGARPFDLHLVAVEAAFVVLVAALGGRLASGLRALEDALGSAVTGRRLVLPLDGADAARRILDEVSRSRRYGRPLSVTVFAPEGAAFDAAVARATPEVSRAIRSRYVRGRIARMIGGQLRRSDVLFEDPRSGRFVVLTPETDEAGSALLAERIRRASRATGLALQAASASFSPETGFEHAVRAAEGRLDGATGVPRLRSVEASPAE
jgi:hypothetical protein